MANTHGRPQALREGDDKGRASNMGRPNHPPWLMLKKQNVVERNYEVHPNRAAAVWWMFLASANGLVDSKIANMMPKRFPPWSSRWQSTEIAKILTNRAVVGENQRYKTTNGKRKPAGKPEEHFFPCIIAPELFERAQKARALPRNGDLANLFATSAKCECCEQPMKYRTRRAKGKEPEGILCCNNKICPAFGVEWRYLDFEKLFYQFTEGIDDAGLLQEQSLDDLSAIDVEIAILKEERDAKEAEIAQLRDRIGEIDEEIAKRTQEKAEIQSAGVVQERTTNDSDYRLRSRTAARIREIVRELHLAAAGTGPRLAERIELVRQRVKTEPDITKDLIEGIEELKNTPFVMADFEDGRVIVGVPNKNDPKDIELSESEPLGGPIEPGPPKARSSRDVLPPVKLLIRYTIPTLPGGRLKIEIGDPGGGNVSQ